MFFNKQKTFTEEELTLKEQQMKVQEESWHREKNLLERQYKMQRERKEVKPSKKSTTTSKFALFFLFANCTVIEIFTMWATYKSLVISEELGTYADFSPLVALVGAAVTEVIALAAYYVKSKAENQEGGITYLNAQHELNMQASVTKVENNMDSSDDAVG